MSKPVLPVQITTVENTTTTILAVFDTCSFYTVIREDKLPSKKIIKYSSPKFFGGAVKGSKLKVIGSTKLIVEYENKQFYVWAEIAPKLSSEMIIGAGSMQSWDISIINTNGKTTIHIAHDRRDPELNIIEELNPTSNC